ncbi:class I SAM-dependent methyltransferase [Candidatus Latescibacterota bacterium]
MEIREKEIGTAEEWVKTVWDKAVLRWSTRSGQDKSYREHVIYPALRNILSKRFSDSEFRLLDLGCGDGIFLESPENRKFFERGAYLGIDVSGELLAQVEKIHGEENVNFLQSNLSESGLSEKIKNKGKDWNCALSVFVIQEIPDLGTVMKNLTNSIRSGAYVIIITVHPDFAVWLKKGGKMHLANGLSGENDTHLSFFRWAGYYPIVNEPNESFYLPYFHRTIEDYEAVMARNGIITEEIIELPEKKDLAKLVNQEISPFKKFDNNDYWPGICEQPSAIAIIARKE